MSGGEERGVLSRIQFWVGVLTLVAILTSVLALGANRPAAWSALAICVTALFAVQAVIDFSTTARHSNKLWLPFVLYLCVLIWMIVQTMPGLPSMLHHPFWGFVDSEHAAISADPAIGRHIALRMATYGMIFWIAVRSVELGNAPALFLRMIAIFIAGLCAFGIYVFLTGVNPILGDESSYDVVRASFINRNSFATYAVIGGLANIAVYFQVTTSEGNPSSASRLRNFLETFFSGAWIYLLGIILCFGAVALSESRGGAGAAIVGVGLFFFFNREKNSSLSWIGPVSIAVVGGLIILTSSSTVISRLLSTTEEEGRFLVYRVIMSAIGERPLLGHGIGAFHEAFRPLTPASVAQGEWDLAHNSYLENFYELGIPAALALYVAMGLVVFRIKRGTTERRRHRIFSVFALACVGAAGFHSWFDFSLQMPATAGLFAFILGLGWAMSFSAGRSRKQKQFEMPHLSAEPSRIEFSSSKKIGAGQ